MKAIAGLLAGVCANVLVCPLSAQDIPLPDDENGEPALTVTAQRRAQSLESVPIAITALDAAALEAQQIENASDLQLTLPSVSFTKSNFTDSSFTIRGVGDLCVGVSCDSATAIHVNGSPLFGTRLFETEFFDLERIEVLRGPQGTLFGRNATSGVVDIVTAKSDLSGVAASAELEYGNYDSIRATAMVNLPLTPTLGVRAAGLWLDRDGYTRNVHDGSRIDGRGLWALRGSLKWEPHPDTQLDLMVYYFREDDDRLRIQKQLCQYDPTGVLGCLNTRRDYAKTNTNATFAGTLSSEEFLRINGLPPGFGFGSLYDAGAYRNFSEPRDVRTVDTPFTPQYHADEFQAQARLGQDFGAVTAQLTGLYQSVGVDSRQDYNFGAVDRTFYTPALTQLAGYAAAPGIGAYFAPLADGLIPQGPAGDLCISEPSLDNRGVYDGAALCDADALQVDRTYQRRRAWSVEGIISSEFGHGLNFLAGAIYARMTVSDDSYFVNTFPIDYIAGLLGSFTSFGTVADADPANDLPPSYLATSFYRTNTQYLGLESWGVFGELYYDLTDRLKLTAGLRYNNDAKSFAGRSTLASFLNPYSNDGDPFASPFVGSFDADPATPGNQPLQERTVSFDRVTGRAVVDFQATPGTMVYASYARGYKSGGINPPLQPIFAVPDSFGAETIDAFEVGVRNTLAGGALQLNATAFYYSYKDLQLSRIIARTAVNDSVDAHIYGVELESVVKPARDWLISLNASVLSARVAGDQYFADPRDPGAGDPQAVIIKDISNGANCAVTGAGANGFVTAVNAALGLAGPVAFPADGGIASTGAFGICDLLAARGAGVWGVVVVRPGIANNMRGNSLPQAPVLKASAGVQYTARLRNGMTLVPRFDVALTGQQYGNVFNGPVNRIEPFVQANAQLRLNGRGQRWFARAFVQNLFDQDSVTGLYLTDASSGLFTNIFTLEPRRYGLAIGVNF